MKTDIHKLVTLQHAANLIQNNANDLRLAFMKCDGSFNAYDSDIEREIDDMDRTAAHLHTLSEFFSTSSGRIQTMGTLDTE